MRRVGRVGLAALGAMVGAALAVAFGVGLWRVSWRPAPPVTVMALVWARPLPAGSFVTVEDVFAVQIEPRLLSAGVLLTPEAAVGQMTSSSVLMNEFVLPGRLTAFDEARATGRSRVQHHAEGCFSRGEDAACAAVAQALGDLVAAGDGAGLLDAAQEVPRGALQDRLREAACAAGAAPTDADPGCRAVVPGELEALLPGSAR